MVSMSVRGAVIVAASAAQDALSANDLAAIRVGLTLLILLIALLLGPRIARSVTRVPALIETARERRAIRVNGAYGNGENGHGA